MPVKNQDPGKAKIIVNNKEDKTMSPFADIFLKKRSPTLMIKNEIVIWILTIRRTRIIKNLGLSKMERIKKDKYSI